MADRFVVILDANVLHLFRAVSRSLVADHHGRVDAQPARQAAGYGTCIRSQIAAMERAFPESCINGAEGLIPALELPDANDRHVLATATRAGAEHIVTKNLKDFPDESLAPFGIIAVNPDDF